MLRVTCGSYLEHSSMAVVMAVSLLVGSLVTVTRNGLAHDKKVHHASVGEASKSLHVGTRAPDFILTDQDGKPLHLEQKRGNVVVVSFMYTTCVDACPLLTAGLAALC